MMRTKTLGRRAAKAAALTAMVMVGLAVGVPPGGAGFVLRPQAVVAGEPTVADLAVEVSDSADPVRAGQNFHYSVRVRNLGPDEATGVRLVDVLPASFVLVSSTGARWCERDAYVNCELNDIPHGGSATVVLHVRASTPGLYSNTATASSASQDPDGGNNSASESTEVEGTPPGQAQAQLTVVEHVVNDNGGTAKPSDFALAVTGSSPEPAQFSGADAPGTAVALDAGAYSVSQETALGYRTTLSGDCAGSIAAGEAKTCTVSNDDLGPITLTLTADSASVETGARTGYTATMANPNAEAVAVSSVSVSLPGGFAFQSGSTSGALTSDPQIAADGSGQRLSWSGPIALAGKRSASFHFEVTAPASAGVYEVAVAGTIDAPFTLSVTTGTASVTVKTSAQGSGGSSGPDNGSSGGTTGQTTPAPTGAPPPVFRQDADVEPVSGEVLVRPAGTTDFVPLTIGMQVPFGSELDASAGRVAVTTVDANGTLYHADFYEGRFLLGQQLANGVTVLRLSGSDFHTCKTVKRTLASIDKKKPKSTKKTKKLKRSKRVVRHLWASGTGKFRTRGRYLAATVHGTTWLTQDRCDGTRAFVREGVVEVRDLVKRRSIRLGAGHSYLARPGH